MQGDTPSSLKNKNNNATYLVIAPHSLRAGADALATYRNGMVAELQDIYDEFSYGIANPYAIRDFIAYAARNWKTPPRFVALLGKGTYDPKDYLGVHTNLFPILLAPTPDGLFMSDNRYGDFNDDGVPDVALGRISALTNDDVTQYLNKVKAYESSARRPANQAVLLADTPGAAGDFTADSTAVAQALTGNGIATTPIYLGNIAVTDARSLLVSTLTTYPGAGLFNYVGHGGTDQMSDSNLVSNDNPPGTDVLAQLAQGTRPPVLAAFSCSVGDGSNPGWDSLVESLLWSFPGGVVAAFAPTAFSDDAQAHVLNMGLVTAMTGAGAKATLGEAGIAALADFAAKGGWRYLVDTYSVFGDPGLRIQH